MTTAIYLTLSLLILAGFFIIARQLISVYRRYQGLKIITCPETARPAMVEVDAAHAALTSMVGLTDIRLHQCSRWPLKQDCGQECLAELDVASEQDQVNSVLMKWYGGKRCVYCGHQFETLHWLDDKPALQSPEGKLLEWENVRHENLATVLEDYLPVCWNCYLVQYFRLQYPGMVVYQPYKHGFTEQTGFTKQPGAVGVLPASQPGKNEVVSVL
jgi:hypothetical protein